MSIKQGSNYISGLQQDITSKANTDLSNVLSNIDFVVESQLPTAANNYTWYRKYKSGWVEQGGLDMSGTSGLRTITLPIPMSIKHAGIVQAYTRVTDTGSISTQYSPTENPTQIQIGVRWDTTWGNMWLSWEVKGMAA